MAAEKRFENKVKRFLQSQGIYDLGTANDKMDVPPCGYYTKRWGGGRYTKSGLPDMQIVIKGKCLEVELKAENGKPSKLQELTVVQINESSGFAVVLYPDYFDWFTEFVKQLVKEKGAFE